MDSQLTKMLGVATILERLKLALSVHNDKELAYYFNVAPNTISGWKKRDSLDYKQLFVICWHNQINLIWVVYGHGKMRLGKAGFDSEIERFESDDESPRMK